MSIKMFNNLADDLREHLRRLEQANLVTKVEGADWNLEIGTICELHSERKAPTALLFDKIKGYPEGWRLLTHDIFWPKQFRVSLGAPQEATANEIVYELTELFNKFKPVPPKEVKTGPILENVLEGDDVDLFKFPTPKWHERDGGRYMGTGHCVITRDPDTGYVNLGTYRNMIQDKNTLAWYTAPGKDAEITRKKYWEKGEDCPVAITFGQEPILYNFSTYPLPFGVPELDMCGYLKGKPIEVIKGDVTGLPIPATAEIAIEGFAPPKEKESREEGPFGEWTGYYGGGVKMEPVIHVKKLYYRNNPILHCMALNRSDPGLHPISLMVPILRMQLEAAGITGIKDIGGHGRAGGPIIVVSLKQQYLGHAQQVAHCTASLMRKGATVGKYIIVVDDDIDPTDWEQVLWAMCFRVDPGVQVHLLPPQTNSPLDPSHSPEKRAKGDFTSSKVVINACKPYHWIDKFAPVNTARPELKKAAMEKFGYLWK